MSAPSPRARLLAWLPAIIYMALIWSLSSMSTVPSTEAIPFRDKGVHFLEYGVLALLVCHGVWAGTRPRPALANFALATAATIFWGLLDEIHQAYVPGRMADVMDLAADATGALIGALLYLLFRRLMAARQAAAAERDIP